MSERETDAGQKQANQDAKEALAADIATKAEPDLARAISGGDVRVTSETAHRMAAVIARDADKGISRHISEIIKEATRR